MTNIRLKYVDDFVDRTGTARYYFRRPKGKRIPLRGFPGSPQFMKDYEAALAGTDPAKPAAARTAPLGSSPSPEDGRTIDALLDAYFAAPEFMGLAASTQGVYRKVFVRWVRDEAIGHRPVSGLAREHVVKMIGRRSATPGAANDLLKKIRLLMSFAIRIGWRETDPTAKMKSFKGGSFHTWSEEQIAQFEARWPSGTRARLAFALHLYTGQRVSDVARMAWADVSGQTIRVVQQKTGTKQIIPLHPALLVEIAAAKRSGSTILMTGPGKPFSQKGLANYMARVIGDAGLPDECVTHGLRKAAARRLAEAGCSSKQIAAITGHKSLSEVERYVVAAEQSRMAVDAIAILSRQAEFQIPKPPGDPAAENTMISEEWRARNERLRLEAERVFLPNDDEDLRIVPSFPVESSKSDDEDRPD